MSQISAKLGHVVLLIHDYDLNVDIYKKLFKYFNFEFITDENYGIGVRMMNGSSLWVMKSTVEDINNRDGNGLNHIGFNVDSKKDVDQFTEEFLKVNNVETLFDTPKDRPDFTGDSGNYYQVMFELPGKILFEVVFTTFS